MAAAPRRTIRAYRPLAPTTLAAMAPRTQTPKGQERDRALDARGGSTKRTTTFAANYVPLAGGRPSTALPYAAIRPARTMRQKCEEHDREACEVCKARKLGVRKCCAAGHHRKGYIRRKYGATRRTLYCLAHGQPACHSCRTHHKGTQHCCALGHHQGCPPRKYRRRPHAPERPPAVTDPIHVVISDDLGSDAPTTPPPPATTAMLATMQADKRPRAALPAVLGTLITTLSTSPGTLATSGRRLRAGNRGEAMGADSPLLARPRSGSIARDPRPKRHRVRSPPPPRHGNAAQCSAAQCSAAGGQAGNHRFESRYGLIFAGRPDITHN